MNSFSQTSVLTSFFDADSDLENLAPHPKKDQKESSMSSLRFTIHSIQLIKPLPKTRLGCAIHSYFLFLIRTAELGFAGPLITGLNPLLLEIL